MMKTGEWSLPEKVHTFFETIEKNGFEAYAVGGCVRDYLMGQSPSDWDFATDAEPEEVMGIFPHTVPTGVKHGTVTVLLNHTPFEVTTYRTEDCYLDGRRPEAVHFVKSIEEDLSRRDFTINAMAYHPKKGLLDLFGGQEDLRQKCIKTVGNPTKRFSEDALRMLRAVRFACRFDFAVEKETLDAICALAPKLQQISAERIEKELSGMLLSPYPEKMMLLYETGLMDFIFPELSKEKREAQKAMLQKSAQLPLELDLRLSMLLSPLDGETAYRQLKALRFDRRTVETVKLLVETLHAPLPKDDYEVRKRLARLGKPLFQKWLLLQETLAGKRFDEMHRAYEEVCEKGWPISLKELAIDGNDLKETELSERSFSDVLKRLLDVVLRFPEKNTREELLKILEKNQANEI